jgi:hypothetical protein
MNYEAAKTKLYQRMVVLKEELVLLERALQALEQPGVSELLTLLEPQPAVSSKARSGPLLTIKRLRGEKASGKGKQISARTWAVLEAMPRDRFVASVEIGSSTGIESIAVRSAFKTLLAHGLVEKGDGRGEYRRIDHHAQDNEAA